MADQIDILPDGKLPGDVMVSILIKLPIKSLLRFQAVSESWYSLISSTHFFENHLRRQSAVAPNNCLLSLRNVSEDEYTDEVDSEDEDLDLKLGLLDLTHRFNSSSAAEDDVFILEEDSPDLEFDFSLLASCNGLLCLGGRFKSSNDVILWNPATRRYRSLDVPVGDDVYLDFPTLGLCYVDDDFKILVWKRKEDIHRSCDDTPYLYVYSLSSDSWDQEYFYPPKTKIDFAAPTFLGRCMHWLAERRPNGRAEIVVFDVINGAKSRFRLPDSCGRRRITDQQTLVIGGCLSIAIYFDTDGVYKRGIGVWIMEQYGVEDSWVNRYNIRGDFTQVTFPIVSWNDGEIVFNFDSDDSKRLVFLDLHSRNRRYVGFSSYHVLKFFKYVESLASVEPVEDEVDSSGEEGDSSGEEGDSSGEEGDSSGEEGDSNDSS